MKKGFTLVELLVVMIIISILLLIAVPNLSKAFDEGVQDIYEGSIEIILVSSENWFNANEEYLPVNINDKKGYSLDALEKMGVLTEKIYDARVGKDIVNGYIMIEKTGVRNYDYTFHNFDDSLVGYWSLDAEDGYEDLSGTNENAVGYNLEVGDSTDRYGNDNSATYFNGSSDYIDLGYGDGLNPSTNPHTFIMWVKSSSISSTIMCMSTGGDTTNRFYLAQYNSKWDIGVKGTAWGSGVIPVTSDWTFIAVVMDGIQAKLYVNDEGISRTISYTSYLFNRNIHLSNHNNDYYYFWGKMDDVAIYDKAFTEEEILEYYYASK